MSAARVAVIIVNYNSGRLLERCLQSLSAQTVRPDHVVVVDNASSESLSDLVLRELTAVEVIRSHENLGYGGAINRALATLPAVDYVCCLNPDAFPEPNFLESLMHAGAQHPQAGAFACLMLKDENQQIIDGAGDELHVSGLPWRRYHGVPLRAVSLRHEPVFGACAGAAMYRQTALKDVAGFDASYFMYVEDIDLGFRLQLAGYPCMFVPDAVVRHIGSAITGHRSDFSTYYGHRNLVRNYFKNMPMPLLIILLPVHVVMNIVTAILLTGRGAGTAVWRAKYDAFRQLPEAIGARSAVLRRTSVKAIWSLLNKQLLRRRR